MFCNVTFIFIYTEYHDKNLFKTVPVLEEPYQSLGIHWGTFMYRHYLKVLDIHCLYNS